MSRTTTAVLQTIWDCRWSQPTYRAIAVEGRVQPEKLWLCTRCGDRREVTEEECEDCPHWEAVPPHS